jgi:hypothetical protein
MMWWWVVLPCSLRLTLSLVVNNPAVNTPSALTAKVHRVE